MNSDVADGYWPSPWPGEDGGPKRQQIPGDGRGLVITTAPTVTSRSTMVGTMVVLRDPGEVYLLCHTGGDDAVSWVEQIDPVSLATLRRSADLPGGPTWPGGLAAHANGSLYVVFGRYAHRLSPTLELLASHELPRARPYNSFVILPDGSLATKDFGGARPGEPLESRSVDCELVILEPVTLEVLARCVLPEASVARLSADGSDIYVVGVTSLHRVTWDQRAQTLSRDALFEATYLRPGEGYGWDTVLADGSAWFLNNGQGSERYNGALTGLGVADVNEAIVRVDLSSGQVEHFDVHDQPGGLVANPPAIDASRGIAIGYDSGNAVVTAWDYRSVPPRVLWSKSMHHGSHPLLYAEQGIVVLGDFRADDATEWAVLIDVTSGDELVRVATSSPVQSVLFTATGFHNDFYVCSFVTLSRVAFDE